MNVQVCIPRKQLGLRQQVNIMEYKYVKALFLGQLITDIQ